ncbi:ClpXP protease specificity-enhancing factor SspB [Methylocapsa polymorpha]|uniref:ClpXP protease specificity-enhancing factor SspB n=1 Tax=Methylocapsa polymorpha TaxID=3080828 RepID=A0ABZ0HQX3_9HYPH|nr:ClpXP protease specificity-enhancing factor SspB [Methylocapsa sp. RX1]
MATDLIRYDVLVQDALRGVVKKVLSDLARDGLVGDHHFYITFRTHARGVRLSTRMRERYPDEMTIILQHQFWDLSVSDHAFEVGLSFKNIPEMLLIPFDAITRFSDPSVEFDLKFELEDEAVEASANDAGSPQEQGHSPAALETPPLAAHAPDAEKARLRDRATESLEDNAGGASQSGEANVVSIDAFRKKT